MVYEHNDYQLFILKKLELHLEEDLKSNPSQFIVFVIRMI
jgi:hypothetical protein